MARAWDGGAGAQKSGVCVATMSLIPLRCTLCVTQAICHLQQLTLLTSLTPAHELLQLNPARPHPGCDLAALSCKASLRGADVAVLHPEHLAALGQFTALQQLNLRCCTVENVVQRRLRAKAVHQLTTCACGARVLSASAGVLPPFMRPSSRGSC
jgi:hypothetical protein